MRLALDILKKRAAPRAVLTQHRLPTPANVDSIYPNDRWPLSVELPTRPTR